MVEVTLVDSVEVGLIGGMNMSNSPRACSLQGTHQTRFGSPLNNAKQR